MNHFNQNGESGRENRLPNTGDFLVWKTLHFVSKENVIASGRLHDLSSPSGLRLPLP